MKTVTEQKVKLEQKKNRLAAEETRLNLKERKMRTRHLIEIGGLVVKAELDHLPINTLYGALLSLKNELHQDDSLKIEALKTQWTKLGKTKLDQEQEDKIAIILTFTDKPSEEIRSHVRTHNLKWNKVREEWYGYVTNMDSLKEGLATILYKLEVI